jgi:hypothetical protein
MSTVRVLRVLIVIALMVGFPITIVAQAPEPTTREAAIEQAQAEKVKTLHPYVVTTGERLMARAEAILQGGAVKWHPFFENAYAGGGFAFGVGYADYVSPYSFVDVRGSYTASGYKRAEAEFVTPRLFHRRGSLSILGGWREATEVAFYGLGTNTTNVRRLNYDFERPYASALLTVRPTRRNLMVRGGIEFTQWKEQPGHGLFPPVDTAYTSQTLPGLGATVNYVHSQGTAGFDWRTSPGYSRRGGFYGVTFHDYNDRDNDFGFQQIDYEAIQHLPILREAWVISLHALASSTSTKNDQQIPFFMLPTLGSGSTMRGFSSFRFRDRNSLLLQAEWRIMVNRFLDTAVFYDAGKVTAHTSDLDFNGLKNDYGFGLRFHGPLATPLRVELARSNEGRRLVFATSPVF